MIAAFINAISPGLTSGGPSAKRQILHRAAGMSEPSVRDPAQMRQAAGVAIRIDDSLEGIDWHQVKADLAADAFDGAVGA